MNNANVNDLDVLIYTKNILRILYVCPSYEVDSYHRIKFSLLFISGLVLPLQCIVNFIYVAITSNTVNEMDLVDVVGLFLTLSGSDYIIVYMKIYQNGILHLEKRMNTYAKYGIPSSLKNIQTLPKLLVKIMVAYIICLMSVYCLFVIYKGIICERESQNNDEIKTCGLLSPLLMQYKLEGLYKTLLILAEFWSILCQAVLCITIFIHNVILFESVLINLLHLIEKLNALKILKGEILRKAFMDCLEYHIYISELIIETNNLFYPVILVYVIISSIVISYLGYYFIMTFSPGPALLIIAWIVVMFIVCHLGQQFTDFNDDLLTAAYDIAWYTEEHFTSGCSALLPFFLFRIQRNNGIVFGTMKQVNYVVYKEILLTAYSFICFFARNKMK